MGKNHLHDTAKLAPHISTGNNFNEKHQAEKL